MKIPVKEGDVIQGAYRVERVIGMGGMAVVVAAIDLKSNQRVAVKVLLKKAARSEEVVKRFQREQRTISRLSSEHVTRMLGAGIHGSSPYMAMEYLEGQDLSDVLKSRGPLQVSEAVDYVLQAMEAIAEAHSIGVIHRDLKPGNMFLAKGPDGSPFVKVLDFGISKASGAHQSEESSLTQTSAVMGSPFYMSPEQMLSARNVTAASDIWALGVILHQLITGTLPFAAPTPEKVCSRVLNGSPTLLRDINPNLPVALEETIHRCLQRRPQNRFANVADLALKLVAFAPPHASRSVAFITDCVDPSESGTDKIEVKMPKPAVDVPDSPTVVYVAPDSKFSAKRAALTGVFGIAMFALGLGVGMYVSGAGKAAMFGAPSARSPVFSVAPVASPAAPEEAPDLPQPDLEQAPVEMDLDQADPKTGRPNREKNSKKEKPSGGASTAEPETTAKPEVTAKPDSKPEATAKPESKPEPTSESTTTKPADAPKAEEPRKEKPKKPKSGSAEGTPVNPYDSP